MIDTAIFIGCFLTAAVAGWLLYSTGYRIVVHAALIGFVMLALLLAGGSSLISNQFASAAAREQLGWADAGRALSDYGAKHREVHMLLRTRNGSTPEQTVR